jgi:hypothetical protein
MALCAPSSFIVILVSRYIQLDKYLKTALSYFSVLDKQDIAVVIADVLRKRQAGFV